MSAVGVELSAAPSRRGLIRAILRFCRPHAVLLILAIVLGVSASLATTLASLVAGRIVDALLATDTSGAVLLAVVGVALAVLQLVLSAVSRAQLARGGEYFVRDLRDRVADQLATTSLRFVQRHRAGELLQRATAEIASLSAFVRESATALLVTASTVVLTVVVLASQSWMLALVLVVVFLPPSLFVMHRFRSRAGAAFGAEAAAEADVAAEVAETIRVRTLLSAAPVRARRRLRARAAALNDAAVRAQMRTVVLSRWISAMSLIEGATTVAVLVAGWLLVDAGIVSVGVVVTFLLGGAILFSSFSDLVALVGAIEETATIAARANELLVVSAPVAPAATKAREAVAAIDLDDVWFGYDDESPVLRGVTLHLQEGVRYGLAGRSGAGKSTLATVIAGLHPPDRGAVRCAGVDLAGVAAVERAQLVALVPQEVQLGAGTIGDELRLVAPDASDEQLRAGASALGLGEWITSLPAGLDTRVGSGSSLSAGERQLVGLVRVALRDARVIVLDEATSDIDPVTATLVEEALDRLAVGRTIVVVAHRQATLARLDEVLEVSGGNVRSIGREGSAPR